MKKYPFPKADLHLHLDGSFRLSTIWELAEQQKVIMPANTLEEYDAFMVHCSNAQDVNDFLKMFDAPLQVMQDEASITRVTEELIEDLVDKGVDYAEIRFAPQLHCEKGLTMDQATAAVICGRNNAMAKFPEIKINIITCMMCKGTEDVNWKENMETVEVCKKFLGKGVVALDLAGAEGIVPLKNFASLFEKAKSYHLPIICHAGDSQGPDTVKDAIDFGVSRIGHGHHIFDDPELCKIAKDKQIALEICPTSNIQCKTQPSYQEHPAKRLLDMDIPVTINTDNMTMSRVTLEDEYDHCIREMGFTQKDLIKCCINSFRSSFMSEEEKTDYLNKLTQYL